MKKIIFAVATLTFAFGAHASLTDSIKSPDFTKSFIEGAMPELTPLGEGKKPHPSCEAVKLTPDQKTALKEAMYAFSKEAADIEADLKKGLIDYAHALSTTASSRDDGRASATAVTSAVTMASTKTTEFGLNVFFDILTPEQKEPAFECAMHMMKQKAKKALERICADMPDEDLR